MDVLIAGAGPAGAATAIHLARAGWRVTLVDRATFPRDKACSEYLSPEAVRHLHDLGVLPALDAAGGHPLTGTRVIAPRGARLVGHFAQAGGAPFRATGLSIARRVLDAALVAQARAAGVSLLDATTIEELLYEGGAVAGAMVRTAQGSRHALRARVTIGADGLRSVVARRLGGIRHGHPARLAFVAHVTGVRALGAEAEMHVGTAGYVGLNPLGGGLANVALVVPRRAAAAAKGDPDGYFYGMLERFPGVAGRVDRAREARRVLVTGPFAARAARDTAPGALLVGDAAEFFDPFTGEGILTALRGAALAAQVVDDALARRDGILRAEDLAPYAELRRRAFAGKRAVERLIAHGMALPALFDHAVGRLARHGLGHTFVGVTGGQLPPRTVLSPAFLARMLL